MKLLILYERYIPPGTDEEPTQLQAEQSKCNDIAHGILIDAVTKKKHLRIVMEGKSDKFPDGWTKMAVEDLLKKIDGKTQGEEEDLLDTFESVFNLGTKKDPVKYIDDLISLQHKLQEKYNYIKTDKDIVNKVLKAL